MSFDRSKSGFTLIELLVVVALIGILSAFAASKVSVFQMKAQIAAAEADLRVLREAIVDSEGGYLHDLQGIPGFSCADVRLANLFVATNVYGAVDQGNGLVRSMRVDDLPGPARHPGCARAEAFTRWDPASGRGWRGPYVRVGGSTSAAMGRFPSADAVRFEGDASFSARGFYPPLAGLRLPRDFKAGLNGCSIYGFPGEPAMMDPWGNPYVLQIPPPQAFSGASTNVSARSRFRYARVVSAGPDGVLAAPCFGVNATNWTATSWSPEVRRLSRQAGLTGGSDRSARGDDLVLFLERNDVDEGESDS